MDFLLKLGNIKHQNKTQQRGVTGYVVAVGSTVSVVYMVAINCFNVSQNGLHAFGKELAKVLKCLASPTKSPGIALSELL